MKVYIFSKNRIFFIKAVKAVEAIKALKAVKVRQDRRTARPQDTQAPRHPDTNTPIHLPRFLFSQHLVFVPAVFEYAHVLSAKLVVIILE